MYFDKDNIFRPHEDIQKKIENENETAFDNLFFFKNKVNNVSLLDKLASEDFNFLCKQINKKLNFTDIKKNLKKIKLIEKNHIKELEELAIKKVKNQFGLIDDVTDKIIPKIVNEINNKFKKEKLEIKNQKFTKEENENIKKYIEKRKIQNALCMGAGFKSHIDFNSIKSDLDKIDKRLFNLYQETIPSISLFFWENSFNKKDMETVEIWGISQFNLDKERNIKVNSNAIIFPILVHEVTKSAIDLLFLNSTKELTEKFGKNVAEEIILQSDVFDEEIWMKRIGPPLWKYLQNAIDYVIIHEKEKNYALVSYLLHDISMMNPKEFIEFMNIIIYDGENSIKIIDKMICKIEKNNNFNEVEDIIKKMQINLQNAIFEERFEDAIKIKDELQKLNL